MLAEAVAQHTLAQEQHNDGIITAGGQSTLQVLLETCQHKHWWFFCAYATESQNSHTIKQFVVGNDNQRVHRDPEGFNGLCCLQQAQRIGFNSNDQYLSGSAALCRYRQLWMPLGVSNFADFCTAEQMHRHQLKLSAHTQLLSAAQSGFPLSACAMMHLVLLCLQSKLLELCLIAFASPAAFTLDILDQHTR